MADFSNGYILGFATAVCVVASVALSGTHAALQPLQELNAQRDYQKDVLSALGLPEDGHVPYGEEIDQLWSARVGQVVVDRATGKPAAGKTKDDVDAAWAAVKGTPKAPELLSVYTRKDGDTVGTYAIEVRGRGLWGPIAGFLALEPDASTISGTVFFAPGETPGLGLEITSDWFEGQWKGKTITAGGKPTTIQVVKGKAADNCKGDALQHCVDGVSGATLTCRGVNQMVAAGVEMYEPTLSTLRAGGSL